MAETNGNIIKFSIHLLINLVLLLEILIHVRSLVNSNRQVIVNNEFSSFLKSLIAAYHKQLFGHGASQKQLK